MTNEEWLIYANVKYSNINVLLYIYVPTYVHFIFKEIINSKGLFSGYYYLVFSMFYFNL